MAKIANNLTELIGGTPLMKLAGYSRKYGLQREVVAKLESFNPAGSVKDRVGLAMIEDAEARGALKPGATIIEPTSGNTGVGLAMVATIKGYHLILTMPETMSIERRNLLKALGAEIVLTDGLAGMASSSARRFLNLRNASKRASFSVLGSPKGSSWAGTVALRFLPRLVSFVSSRRITTNRAVALPKRTSLPAEVIFR